MSAREYIRLLRRPSILLGSVSCSCRATGRPPRDLPVRANARARVRRHPTASVDLGGYLFLGCWPPNSDGGVGPATVRPTVLDLKRDARIVTDGWVILGPGVEVVIGEGANVRIGEETYISADARVLAVESISIGARCAISWDVQILDSDMHGLVSESGRSPITLPVTIDDDVWIGVGAKILKGVTIGHGAVVGAGAVVTKDVPPRAVVAGAPARIVNKEVAWT